MIEMTVQSVAVIPCGELTDDRERRGTWGGRQRTARLDWIGTISRAGIILVHIWEPTVVSSIGQGSL